MSSTEKLLNEHGDTLILRPPVGAEVYQSPVIETEQPEFCSRRSQRLGMIYCLVISALFVMVSILFGFLVWRSGPFPASRPSFARHQLICRLLVPEAGISSLERISVDSDALNVTLSDYPTPSFSQIRILHLPHLALTVVRTQLGCYMRWMRSDLLRAFSNGYLDRLSLGNDLHESVSARLVPVRWCMTYPSLSPADLQAIHPRLGELCEGVSAYRLSQCSDELLSETATFAVPPVAEDSAGRLCPPLMCGPNCVAGLSRQSLSDGTTNDCPVCRCPPLHPPPNPESGGNSAEADQLMRQGDLMDALQDAAYPMPARMIDADDDYEAPARRVTRQESGGELINEMPAGVPFPVAHPEPSKSLVIGMINEMPPPVALPVAHVEGGKALLRSRRSDLAQLGLQAKDMISYLKFGAVPDHGLLNEMPAPVLFPTAHAETGGLARARRSNQAQMPGMDSAKLSRVAEHIKPAGPTRCQLAEVFVEDATIPTAVESEFVRIVQDVIYACPPQRPNKPNDSTQL